MVARGSRLFFLLRAARRHRLEREPQQLTDARVLLPREAFQRRALIGGDAHRNLAMRIPRRFATIEIESRDGSAHDFACGGETVTFADGLDSRDERFGEIKREWGRRLAR